MLAVCVWLFLIVSWNVFAHSLSRSWMMALGLFNACPARVGAQLADGRMLSICRQARIHSL